MKRKKGEKEISIIIPCRNEQDFIEKLLESIIKQDYKGKIEVLVIDGMSEDRTRDIVKSFCRKYRFVKLLDNKKKITSVALNIGIKKARGEIIMRVDAHSLLSNNYIKNCVKALEKYKADAVGGVWKIISRENSIIARAIALVLQSRFGSGLAYYKIGINKLREVDAVAYLCCKKSLFKKVGYFNEKLERGQDMEFNLRLKKQGGKILLIPCIVSCYYSRSNIKDLIKHNFINGIWAILPFKFSKIMPVSFRHLIPLFFILSLLLSGIFGFFSVWFFYLFLGILGFYLIVNLIYSFFISVRESDLILFFIMPFIFMNLHFSYGFGSLAGLFKLISLKRLFDFLLSAILIFILSPLMLVLSFLIKINSKGSVIYKAERIGLGEKNFFMYKFRSMVENADKLGGFSVPSSDKRITKIGRIIRKYKLDELPELINILKGEMSFVGPRPELEYYINKFNKEEREILSVKQGITDFASIRFRNEAEILEKSNIKDKNKAYEKLIWPEKKKLQLKYVEERSFFLDIKLILKTIKLLAKL